MMLIAKNLGLAGGTGNKTFSRRSLGKKAIHQYYPAIIGNTSKTVFFAFNIYSTFDSLRRKPLRTGLRV